MRLEITYTIEDLEEGLVSEAFARDPRRYRRRLTFAAVPWMLVVVMAGFLIWIESLGPGKRQALPHDVVTEMIPNDAAAGFLCAAIVLFIWSNWKRARRSTAVLQGPAKRPSAGQRLIVVLVVLAVISPFVLLVMKPDWTWYATREELLLANCAPWALVFALFLVLISAHSRWAPRQHWRANPVWERRRTLELDDSGIRITDALMDLRYAWPYFRRAWETPNLLVLAAENQLRYFIPKRVFANTTELEQARAILQNKIATTNFLVSPTGFSMVPKPVLPLDRKEQSSPSV